MCYPFLWLVDFFTVIPILPSQEKTKKEQHKKLGEEEETIPPEYRLTEAKVIYLMCLVLLPFHSSENMWVKLRLPFHFGAVMFWFRHFYNVQKF